MLWEQWGIISILVLFILAIPGMLCLFWVAPWKQENNKTRSV